MGEGNTYTCTLFNSTLDVTSSAGCSSTERAARPTTKRATVVKKPKTAWMRLRDEYIAGDDDGRGQDQFRTRAATGARTQQGRDAVGRRSQSA